MVEKNGILARILQNLSIWNIPWKTLQVNVTLARILQGNVILVRPSKETPYLQDLGRDLIPCKNKARSSLVENKCIPWKDLARSLQNTHYLQDLARKFFLTRSYKEMFSLKDLARKRLLERSYKEMFSLKDLARKCFPCKILEFNVLHTEKLC